MREPSADIQLALLVVGGRNQYGEPNYRAIWGRDRMEWIGGFWGGKDDVFESRLVPRYAPPAFYEDRWYLERWMPPEFYGAPAQWVERTKEYYNGRSELVMGPYPSRGDYEHIFTCEDPETREFIQLTGEIAKLAVELNRENQNKTIGQRMKERAAAEAYDAKQRSNLIQERMNACPITTPSKDWMNFVLRMLKQEGTLAHADNCRD